MASVNSLQPRLYSLASNVLQQMIRTGDRDANLGLCPIWPSTLLIPFFATSDFENTVSKHAVSDLKGHYIFLIALYTHSRME